jgi:hypothetical protein
MTITLKNVPEALHRKLKRQAKLNKRSLNQDLINFLEEKAGMAERQKVFADAIRHRNELARRGFKIPPGMEPGKLIRQDRDSR